MTIRRLNNSGEVTRFICAPFLNEKTGSYYPIQHYLGPYINSTGEETYTYLHLNSDVQSVKKIRFFGVSSGPSNSKPMKIYLRVYGAAPNEIFNTESVAVSKASEEDDYSTTDVVHWELTSTDDIDIGHLVGGNQIAIKVCYDAGDASNNATHAYIQCVEVEYIPK